MYFVTVIRYLKSSSDLFVSKNRLKLLKLTRNSFMLSMLDFILFVTGLYPIFFFFLVCVHDTRTYTFLNMLIWTSTLYHQETGFTTFLHKSSFITFILKTSFTPILYVSTLAFKNTKVWMYNCHDFQHLGEDEVNCLFFFFY